MSRIIEHVTLKVADLEKSRRFYKALIEILGHTFEEEGEESFTLDGLRITKGDTQQHCTFLSFKVPNPISVNLFHQTALKMGGRCNGAPSYKCSEHAYGAEIIDPDGNHLEALFQNVLKL